MADEDEDNPCAGRWKNMRDEKMRKMWGVFDESGIFMSACRHGFSLLIADMVQSGEQSKYPLAVVSKLLDTFWKDLGGGYDVGCRFKTTLSRSSLGRRAHNLNHTSLVGAFHGHAHRRLCQLNHLTTYIDGLGLEDLEGCERIFSKSNALAASVRYASIFHRRQAIANYFQHNDDFEVYVNLTTFLYNNYKQALNVLHDAHTTLPKLMAELGVTDDNVFDAWLAEERSYLMSLTQEPEHETLHMEYWQRLVNLSGSRKDLDAASMAWAVSTPRTVQFGAHDVTSTTRNETAWRHTIENYDKDLKVVQELEVKLGITRRWVPDDPEWRDAGCLVANRKLQRALDNLEGLVVARIFELSKMNRAGTGYKLRKHIGKALKVRSATIRTALDKYNTAARAVSPPRATLSWEDVVEYAFVADFDLLRDARQDVSHCPWATPTGRHTMDTYFKMRRASEEIQRLNVEIRRMATYLRDEELYLTECQKQLQSMHPALAHQVGAHRNIRARFTSYHLRRLHEISALPGFTGLIAPGESVEEGPGAAASAAAVCIPAKLLPVGPTMMEEGEDEVLQDLEEEIADADGEEDSRVLEAILQVAGDA
ncbi:uncharacterized protein F5891DRAFT_976459 [Suillus fuscotomentosus]|uniref:Uncharacterized protein n=1 Tax=Suillus fuscotomentosus TaxID=1912939 RepID=A0AAD4HR58_9AGAM|nr:uncharacterized protein F5891DRAFT_976459 [Suillus fuscotomentosus]KAG1905546.1 hypothetical protein F5891DRAFT_976459 [Suillus fuscotomentosus]